MEFVGKTVKKRFEGFGVFTGTVQSYDSSSGFFVIAYEDGDIEELDFIEVAALLRERDNGAGEAVPLESSFKLGRKPRKRRRVEPRDRENEGGGEASDLDMNRNDGSVGDLGDREIVNGNLGGNAGLNGSETLGEGKGGTGGIDLNLNLDELNEEGGSIANCDAQDGFMGTERKMECIDLNLDVSGELDEALEENGETQMKECGFDLNLGISDDGEEGIMEVGGVEVKEERVMCQKVEIAVGRSQDDGLTNNVRDGPLEDVGLSSDGTRGEDVDALKEIRDCGDGTSIVNASGVRENSTGVIDENQGYGGSVSQVVTDGPKRRGRRRKIVDNPNSTPGTGTVDVDGVTAEAVRTVASQETIGIRRSGRRRKVVDNLNPTQVVTSKANEVKEDCTTGTDGNKGDMFSACKEVSGTRRRGRKRKIVDNLNSIPEAVVFADANGVKDDSTICTDEKEGDVGSTYGGVNGSGRKKQVFLYDLGFVPETTVLRRSSRRGSAKNNISSATMSRVAKDLSGSPAGSALTEEKLVKSPCEWPEEPVAVPLKASLPPSSQNLDLVGIPVFDLFSIYACLRSFSTLLFLSPFELEEFVTAVKCNYPSTLFGCIHVSILQTLRKHLEHLSSEGSESASSCLRNLNWDLLDLITWPVFMVEYLLIHGSDLKLGFDLSHLKLFKSEYHKQPASVKVEILRCLCDDMIEVDAIRSEINRRCLGIESDLDFDRGVNTGTCRKKRAKMNVSGGSQLTEVAADDTNDWNIDECCLCKMDGSLICCDGCPSAYHSKCVGVASSSLPEGNWYCPECAIERHKSWTIHRKSVRGAELLGVDPYSRLYFSSCGYLLVSDSCDDEFSFKYYHRDDLNVVIEVLKSSGRLYGTLLKSICKHWEMPALLNGTGGNFDSVSHSICLDVCIPSGALPLSDRYAAKNKTTDGRKPEEQLHTGCSDLPEVEMSIRCMTSEGSAEIMQMTSGIQNLQKEEPALLNISADFSNESDILGNPPPIGDNLLASDHLDATHGISVSIGHAPSSINPADEDSIQVEARSGYINLYSFGHTASSIAEVLMSKSQEKTKEVPTKTYEEIVSTEMKIISKKAAKFSWPNTPSLSADVQKEMCGWCYCCRYPIDGSDCLVNMTLGPVQEESISEVVGIQVKRNRRGYLTDIVRYILLIEDRLQGLLIGPWLNSHYSRIWRETILMAADIVSVRHSLLMLESNLHRLALSVEWWKHVDSAVTMGSASHIATASLRASSKNVVVRKRVRSSDFESNSSSSSDSGLVMFWHRGGRLSRKLFSWKVLPNSLVSKAAREAGSTKVPGILYPENSDFTKRSKYVMWRAAVDSSTTVEQLALQVRELDSNIKWNEIENTHPLPILDKEFIKSIRLFKKVIIRRKCVEEGGVKYLLDFGKRRSLPEVVLKNGVRVEEPSSERKKYWLNESYVPLHILKNFEEKRIARKSDKMGPGKLSQTSAGLHKPQKKQGFSYLFAKAERAEHYQCGHCNKDVPIREAVSCQHCNGFFHRRHVKKSAGSLIAECVYECHRCSGGKHSKTDVKTKKNISKKGKKITKSKKVQEKKSEKATVSCKSVQLKNSKKPLKSSRPLRSQSKKKVSVVPLRRSPRKAKYKALQNKKVAGRKRGRPPKSKKGPYQKLKKESSIITKKRKIENSSHRKRTMTYYSYWVNGLHLSRKPDDRRVMVFRGERLLEPFQRTIRGQPKCMLCCEAGYTSSWSYISCEMCGDWFHGDAFGLDAEKISKLIGFRCHVCRETPPPVCPYLPEL